MGILVSGEDNESTKLQERISADLRARADESSRDVDDDLNKDSDHYVTTHKTSAFSWFWLILIALAAISLIIIFVLK